LVVLAFYRGHFLGLVSISKLSLQWKLTEGGIQTSHDVGDGETFGPSTSSDGSLITPMED